MPTTKNQPQQVHDDEFASPEGYNEQMQGAMGDGVQLSIYAPFLPWFNGEAAYKNSGVLAAYTGGFSLFMEDAQVLEKEHGYLNSLFSQIDGLQSKEKEYSAMLSQWLPVAVIGSRQRWIRTIDQRTGQESKPRSHSQVFVYVADVVEDAFVPYAPMVLTVKGMQTDYLMRSLNEWRTKSAKARRDVAKGLSETAFWTSIGVFSKKRETVQVGTPPNAQQIAPIGVMLPPSYDRQTLLQLYIGKEIAQEVMQLRADNREWLEEWKKQEAQQRAQAPAVAAAPAADPVSGTPFDYQAAEE